MTKIAYTDITRADIIVAQSALGMVLIEDRDHSDGKFLIFGTPEEHAARFLGQPQNSEVTALKAEIEKLKTQIAAMDGRIVVVEKAAAK